MTDFPAGAWNDPEPAGWRTDRLDALAADLAGGGSTALMVAHGGRLVWQAGDVARKSSVASVRKSLLNLLFGVAAGRGRIDIDATLADLGIDDVDGLSAVERGATVRHLLQARSGVYHPAVYDTPKDRPPRGAFRPGGHWFYNNWDFNALGTVFERMAGESVRDAFGPMLAEPLGMQDHAPDDIRFLHGPESAHPVYKMRFSARDLARVGLLVLDGGRWRGRQVVPAGWLAESLRPRSEIAPGRFYGMLWCVTEAHAPGDPLAIDVPIVYAAGFGGQYVVVAPRRRLVVVHRAAQVDNGIGHERMGAVLRAVAAAMP